MFVVFTLLQTQIQQLDIAQLRQLALDLAVAQPGLVFDMLGK